MGEVKSHLDEGLYMATVKVGPKGQIVIPKEVREMFAIAPGDKLLLLADRQRGVAIHRLEVFSRLVDQADFQYLDFAAGVHNAAKENEE